MFSSGYKKIVIVLSIFLTVAISLLLLVIFFSQKTSIKTKGENQQTKSIKLNTNPEIEEEPYKKNNEVEKIFYKKNPLAKYIPYYGENFEITYSGKVKNGVAAYKITLYVILNDSRQLKQYKEDYLKYKIEALDWIESKGVDYKSLEIEWEPEDPKNINTSAVSNSTNLNNSKCKTCQ